MTLGGVMGAAWRRCPTMNLISVGFCKQMERGVEMETQVRSEVS